MRRLRHTAAALLTLALAISMFTSPAHAQETTIEVELGSFYIDMPETIPAGPVTLEVTNVSNMPHTIAIEGNGETITMPVTLVPAGPTSATWEIDLAPGTYTIWCPIGAHRDQGMEITITVEGEASEPEPPPATTAPEPTATPEPPAEPTATDEPAAPDPTATDEPVATEAPVEPTETPAAVDTSYLDEVAAEPEPTAEDPPVAIASESDSDGMSTGLWIALGAGIIAIVAIGGGLYYRRSGTTD